MTTSPGRLAGKVCVITGAGGGMGREAAVSSRARARAAAWPTSRPRRQRRRSRSAPTALRSHGSFVALLGAAISGIFVNGAAFVVDGGITGAYVTPEGS